MDDADLIGKINELAREEHRLFELEGGGGGTDQDRERLKQLQVTLDQCWDLLRQRRALKEAGEDPSGARVRPSSTGEGYRS